MKRITTSILATCLLSGVALAEKPNFTYADAAYTVVKSDDISAQGVTLKGAYQLEQNFYLLGSYSVASDDFSESEYFLGMTVDSDVEMTLYDLQLGVGYQFDINDDTLIGVDVSYYRATAEADVSVFIRDEYESYSESASEKDSANGAKFRAAVYSTLSPEMEGSIGLFHKYVRYAGDNIDDTGVFAELQYKITPQIALGLSVEAGEDKIYSLGGRFYF